MASARQLEEELAALKVTLASREEEIAQLKLEQRIFKLSSDEPSIVEKPEKLPVLVKGDIERYSRQLILPELRAGGQRRLKVRSILTRSHTCAGFLSLGGRLWRAWVSCRCLPGSCRSGQAGAGGPRLCGCQ